MNIKNKITLLTTFWLICILIGVNLIVYFSFIKIVTSNEKETLQSKMELLLEQTKPDEIMKPNQSVILQKFLPENAAIRVLDKSSKIINSVANDEELAKITPEFVSTTESELYRNAGQQILIVRLPILSGNQVMGSLEIVERLEALEGNINTLVYILVFSTVGALILSVISGLFLSKLILRPISRIIHTMEEIEGSLIFKQIPLKHREKDELHKMVETFNRMMGRIEQSFVKQQQFVSDASHELKTPITIIESYAKMLRRWGMNDEKVQREAIATIYEESVRMKQLTQHLLDLVSLDDGGAVSLQTVNMMELCGQTAKVMRRMYKRDIEIQSEYSHILISADSMKLKQLLLILLDNALKYSKTPIIISLFKDQAGVYFRIKDRGIGIPKEELKHVFNRFYRVDRARQRQTGGAGLGLSIAQSIVKQSKGDIKIFSEENVGTVVEVFLPYPVEQPSF
ncbi:MAG: integral rane sensor signal transduction histidine kinase [Bacilli bacterium]|nr:integral rane sensor signal transduction histidine kinase [Bacilli bacterium]